MIKNLDDSSAIAFTDGSFSNDTYTGGYGVILITKDSEKQFIKNFNKDKRSNLQLLKLHSVGAECEAIKRALKEAVNLNKKHIEIFYDYEGIEKWITHEWDISNPYIETYYDYIISFSNKISINFHKIKSHAGIYYNDLCDKLAKSALHKY